MSRTMAVLLCGATVLLVFISQGKAYGDGKRNFGGWLRNKMEKADSAVQKQLKKRPKTQNKINRGIDKFADNMIEFATPEADENCRRIQKDAIHMILNPSHSESNRRYRDMVDTISGNGETASRSSRSSSSKYRSSSSSTSSGSSSSYNRRRAERAGERRLAAFRAGAAQRYTRELVSRFDSRADSLRADIGAALLTE